MGVEMLKERTEILVQGNVISKEVGKFVNSVIDVMNDLYPSVNSEDAVMFFTHLSMATQRVCKGEPVETLDEAVWEEVAACREYQEADRFYLKVEEMSPTEYPESERQFLIMHLCNLFQK